MSKVVLASGNAGKLKELQNALDEFGVELVTQKALNIEGAKKMGLPSSKTPLKKHVTLARNQVYLR